MKPDMQIYDQPIKNEVRQRVLQHAVEALTSSRESSPVVTEQQFIKTLAYCRRFILKHVGVDIYPGIYKKIQEWFSLYASRVGKKTSKDIYVLILSGPNPTNDFRVLMDLGIPVQNIWAIEGDANAHKAASQELLEAGISAKLHKGSLHEFFNIVPQQFDIVYFDACGPLFGGKPNTIQVLRELFVNQRLTSLSALITNFSAANQDGTHGRDWAKRLAVWYAPWFEEPIPFDGELFERIVKFEQYLDHIERSFHEYYSDFTSRFTIDFAAQLLPWWRVVALPGAKREYFSSQEKLSAAITASIRLPYEPDSDTWTGEFGHAQLSNESYPYLWIAERSKTILESDDPLRVLFQDAKIQKTSLSDAVKSLSLIRNFFEGTVAWGRHNVDACSPELANILATFKWFDSEGQKWYRMFCDEPLPNLIVDLLIGLYGCPYHINLNKLLRIHYTAKVTPMYTDVFLLDQARYLYDLIPTLSLFEKKPNFPNQIILRICMDAIRRHAFLGCPDLYQGCALACMGEEGFDIFRWPKRETLKL